MKNNNLILEAKAFAISAHDSINHRRKYTDEPYHVHPGRVADIVASVTTDEALVAAAWLHDVLEDVTPNNPEFNENAIEAAFGNRVLKLVLELTDVSKPSDGNRATRKAIDRLHSANASPDAKTVKLADLIDNYIDISQHDPHFARVFKKEARLLLPHLLDGNTKLYEKIKALIG